MTFTVLTLSQMANVMAVRSGHDSLFSVGLMSNRALVLAVFATVVLQLVLIYVPLFQHVFNMVPLTGFDLFVALMVSSAIFWIIEIEKLAIRMFAAKGNTAT